jgi:hypothetical protein
MLLVARITFTTFTLVAATVAAAATAREHCPLLRLRCVAITITSADYVVVTQLIAADSTTAKLSSQTHEKALL